MYLCRNEICPLRLESIFLKEYVHDITCTPSLASHRVPFCSFKDMVDFPRYKYGFVDCEVLAYSSNVKSLHTVLNFRIQFRLYFSYCGFIISNYQLLVYISIYHTHNYYPSATNQEYQQRILCIPHIYKFNFFKNRTMLRSKFATYI